MALLSASSITARPSASFRHCSSEFASRVPISPLHNKAIDHDVDVVGELLVERLDVADFVEGAVDLDPLVALLQQLGEFLAVLALAAAHQRRQHVDARAFRQFENTVDHLADGLAFNGQSGGRRIGDADARPQQAHVVVDLGDGADGRAGVLRGGLLLDGDGGRQAVDLVEVRLLHHLEELAGVSRERLHVAALALGIDGVEGERGLARAGQAGEHHQLVARDGDVDVLEIVLAGAADGDGAGVAAAGFMRRVGHGAFGRHFEALDGSAAGHKAGNLKRRARKTALGT